jgi:hypothetical protein
MKFIRGKLKQVIVIETLPASLVPKSIAYRRILIVAKEYNMTNIEAFAAIAIICKKEVGTAKSEQESVYAIIKGKKVELTRIRRLIRNQNLNFTLRQCARTYASNIYLKSCTYLWYSRKFIKENWKNKRNFFKRSLLALKFPNIQQ